MERRDGGPAFAGEELARLRQLLDILPVSFACATTVPGSGRMSARESGPGGSTFTLSLPAS